MPRPEASGWAPGPESLHRHLFVDPLVFYQNLRLQIPPHSPHPSSRCGFWKHLAGEERAGFGPLAHPCAPGDPPLTLAVEFSASLIFQVEPLSLTAGPWLTRRGAREGGGRAGAQRSCPDTHFSGSCRKTLPLRPAAVLSATHSGPRASLRWFSVGHMSLQPECTPLRDQPVEAVERAASGEQEGRFSTRPSRASQETGAQWDLQNEL